MWVKMKLKPGKQNDMNNTYCPLVSLEHFAGQGFHFLILKVNIHVQITYIFIEFIHPQFESFEFSMLTSNLFHWIQKYCNNLLSLLRNYNKCKKKSMIHVSESVYIFMSLSSVFPHLHVIRQSMSSGFRLLVLIIEICPSYVNLAFRTRNNIGNINNGTH